jgi:F420-non-reducing hydrogenase small subunit
MPDKPKIALYWCSSCGGCEESVIDLSEGLLELFSRTDIVFWPVALDSRRKDLEALGDGEIDVSLINGAIRLQEQVHMARLLRLKSKIVVAHGTCAHLGGIVGLGNFHTAHELLSRSFREVPTVKNRDGILPGEPMEDSGTAPKLSGLTEKAMTLDQVIEVDYTIPGCPPPPELVGEVLWAVLEGELPKKGFVFGERKALCHTCPRLNSRPERIRVKRFKRIHETAWLPEKCFLPQGLICLGPATRGGCGSRCIRANMPCRGCFGPLDAMEDHGAGMVSFIAAMIDSDHEDEIRRITDTISDPGGLFYRYSVPSSLLGRGRRKVP